MNAKEIQAKIRELNEAIQEAMQLKNASRPGTLAYDSALKVIEVHEEEIEMLENQLRIEQAGGEII